MSRGDRADWEWRDRASGESGLRYEPGNWGDLLKTAWVLRIFDLVDDARRARGEVAFRYLDPCAGAPSYPLSDRARERFEHEIPQPLRVVQESFLASGCLASTARCVLEHARSRGTAVSLAVFDSDPDKRDRWLAVPEARVIEPTSAAVAIATHSADLVVVDPYDLFDRWGEWLPSILAAARAAPVVVYFLNKSPRSAGHFDQYQRLRGALAARSRDIAVLLGRIAADAILPRSFHELALVGPRRFVENAREGLSSVTRELSRVVTDLGAFESLD